MKEKEDKLRLVKQILVEENGTIPILKDSADEEPQQQTATKTPGKTEIRSRIEKLGVANPRYRRSQSADRWVDHRPEVLIPVGSVLQPLMRRRRSVTKLTSPKEITDGASRYCLTAQNQDSEGELETKLYKVK
jgi:kinesin family protein 23